MLLVTFVVLNIINVIAQTIKSLATVKGGKMMAALINAFTYGLYTVVIVYTVCELPLWQKVIVVALCNLVGVYVVKYIEEKARKDKLWKVEMTVCATHLDDVTGILAACQVPYTQLYSTNSDYILVNAYCVDQEASTIVKNLVKKYHVKYFVTETKNL